ncbi:polysaccharide pyruvyl transferase family protein [Oxalicibacterium solurbis]|uniref:Putative pyruvyl transferase EpsO n=1 Tax=Oxalicibacterium solurbis TaxID=69280 RepID=A0A8J3B324_9BURK|nr:polysaccharide pyruvyl transferase family protein [Oxalicibacterium solurbis]GGI54045.1 putative pyruvyl transferase EpsO [Oxalicibacterium solurbis]
MEYSGNHVELCNALMERHAVLAALIGDAPFHYVDIPTHGNVGDLLIMHGTLAFFRKQGLQPKTIAPHDAFDTRWVAPGDVVVFHGGGNFGDLYPCFQQLRERVVQSCKDNRIVILPQSLHFSSDETMLRSAHIFRQHGDVHLCVRDRASLQTAALFTDNVLLLPDMAHQLYPLQAPQAAYMRPGALRISRIDDEAGETGDIAGAPHIDMLTDWPQFVGRRERRIELFRRAYGAFFRRGMGRWANRVLSPMWIGYSNRLIADAAKLFARHHLIVTDRLHGHILACLLDRNSIVLDNSYGKNSRYVQAWTRPSELVVLNGEQNDEQGNAGGNEASGISNAYRNHAAGIATAAISAAI